MKKGELRRIVTGNVLWLSVVSLLNDAASEMIFPLLPAFLVGVLGAGPAFLGLVEGVAETTSSLVKLAGGWLSDRSHRRKGLVVGGYGVAVLVRPLIALATAPWHVLAIRFTDRVGKGLRTAPRDALLSESVDPDVRGRAFGVHRAADHTGAFLGPLLASGILLLAPGRLRLVFALTVIPGLLTLLAVAVKVKERPARRADAPADVPGPPDPTEANFAAAVPPTLRRFLLVVVVFTLGNASDAFLLLRAGDLGVALALIPLLWTVLHVSKTGWSLVGGTLADRVGPRTTILAGWLVYAATYAGFALASRTWHAWALFVLYGLYYGLSEAPEKTLVSALAAPDRRATGFGAYHAAVGIAALPASLVFGLVWQRWGAGAAFFLGAGLGLLATVLLLAVLPGDAGHGPARPGR